VENIIKRIQVAIDVHNEKHIRPFRLHISYGYDIFSTDGEQKIDDFFAHIEGLIFKSKENHRRTGDTVIGVDL